MRDATEAGARRDDDTGCRVLLVDDHVPQAAIGAGHPRGAAVLRALARWAPTVEVCALQPPLPDRVPAEAVPGNARVVPGTGIDALAATLAAGVQAALPPGVPRGVLWVARPNNMQAVERLQRVRPDLLGGWRIVYDAEALFALREVGARALQGDLLSEHQRRRLLRAELRPAEAAEHVVCVSAEEAALVREHVRRPVTIASYPATIQDDGSPWAVRRGALFVGAATDADSPNGDGLLRFLAGPMPRLAAEGVPLSVVGRGTSADGWLAAHAAPRAQVALHGPVPDLAPHFATALAFVAPIRYGAGIPIKVLEAARHGLPVVATPFVAAQLGWRDGEELLVAHDDDAWLRAVRTLARDQALWQHLRAQAHAALRRDHAPELFETQIAAAAFGARGQRGGARYPVTSSRS